MITQIINKNISKSCFYATRNFSTNRLILKDIWVISDGILENERQSIALAKGLNLDYEVHRVVRKKFMWWLPNFLQSLLTGGSSKNKSSSSDQIKFQLPWYLTLHPASEQTSKTISSSYPPQFVISSGLETVLTVQDFRKRLPHSTQFVHINYPKIPFKHFDWVVLAKHERLKLAHLGPALSQQKNVVFTQMMLNSIKQDINLISQSKLKDQVPISWVESNNGQPTLGILVSGVHSEFLYLKEYADRFSKDLQTLITKFGARVILYYNQETPHFIKKSIQSSLQGLIKSNPDYKNSILEYSTTKDDIKNNTASHTLNHIISLSSHLVVFSGNPGLISESIATGKPVYLVGANHCRNSLANFVQSLHSKAYVRFFHVSKQYRGVGDPLTYIGQQKPFDKFKVDEVKVTKEELFKLIQEKKELK